MAPHSPTLSSLPCPQGHCCGLNMSLKAYVLEKPSPQRNCVERQEAQETPDLSNGLIFSGEDRIEVLPTTLPPSLFPHSSQPRTIPLLLQGSWPCCSVAALSRQRWLTVSILKACLLYPMPWHEGFQGCEHSCPRWGHHNQAYDCAKTNRNPYPNLPQACLCCPSWVHRLPYRQS